jgi:BlaI family penicillinase repressor
MVEMLGNTPRRTKPTDGELEILSVLWDKGPSTVRDIHEELEKTRDMGRTTVLKLIQIMAEKGIVSRDERSRPAKYTANRSREATRSHLVDDLLTKAFGGSAESLVMHVLSNQKTDPDELKAIQELIAKLEEAR